MKDWEIKASKVQRRGNSIPFKRPHKWASQSSNRSANSSLLVYINESVIFFMAQAPHGECFVVVCFVMDSIGHNFAMSSECAKLVNGGQNFDTGHRFVHLVRARQFIVVVIQSILTLRHCTKKHTADSEKKLMRHTLDFSWGLLHM